MLIPSLTMAKLVTVHDTLADWFLKTHATVPNLYDGVQSRDGGFSGAIFDTYLALFREEKERKDVYLHDMTRIEGGWQRLAYVFPDNSVAVVYQDYGYDARPNRCGGMVIPTTLDLCATLDIPS